MNKLLLNCRTLIFYLLYATFTTVFGLVTLPFIRFLSLNTRFAFIAFWVHCVLGLARIICGIHCRVHGLDNRPANGPYVVLANHQSAIETFLLMMLLKPVSIILKQELLRIPIFGWGLSMIHPIAIDRNNQRNAIRQIRRHGLQRLQEDGMPVLIFPEGTRVGVNENRAFARSGAALAIEAGVPVVFVAHNAGYFWPASHKTKYPGTVDFYFSEPVSSEGRDARELTEQARQWIRQHIVEPEASTGC